jgi:hypothetical protein
MESRRARKIDNKYNMFENHEVNGLHAVGWVKLILKCGLYMKLSN